jgi:RNA polymerase sigma-70 factor (ECF subfamily)
VAELLNTTAAAVNSALQRAKATLASAGADLDAVPEPADEQRAVVDAYVAAFEAADIAGLTRMLHHDVVLEMPPMWNWYRGIADFGAFMVRVFRIRGRSWRCLPLTANGQPAIIAYRQDPDEGFVVHTLQVFTVHNAQITRVSVFQDPDVIANFEAPSRLER